MEDLGKFLKAARGAHSLTIREAGERSGISNAYLNQIENGKIKKPSPEILYKISELYGISYEMLLEKTGYPTPGMLKFGWVIGDMPIVLIVDDDPKDRELYRSFLESGAPGSFRFYEAGSVREAMLLLEEFVPECVFLDCRLPGGACLALLEEIRKDRRFNDISIVMMTGRGCEDVALAALNMGALNYLAKEKITMDVLVASTVHAVNRKRLRGTLHEKKVSAVRNGAIEEKLLWLVTDMAAITEILAARFDAAGNDADFMLLRERGREVAMLLQRLGIKKISGEQPIEKWEQHH